ACPRSVSSNSFSAEWIVLEIEGGALDLRAASFGAKALRDTIMSGYGQVGLAVPEWVSGHDQSGQPSRSPHLAVVPMAFAGFPHADGTLMGFGLVSPAGFDPTEDAGFRAAMRAVTAVAPDGRRRLNLHVG